MLTVMVSGMTGATGVTGIKERWGRQLRIARAEHQLLQSTVADATGLTGATVSRAESGRGSLDVYHRLAAHYGIVLEAGDQS
jgi:transcriptional regulator with XRE-family HTH domain